MDFQLTKAEFKSPSEAERFSIDAVERRFVDTEFRKEKCIEQTLMDNYSQSWRWWVTIEMHIIDELFTVSMPRFYLFIYLRSSYSRKSAFQASSLEICFLNVHYLIHSGPVAIDESILKLKFYLFCFAFFSSPLTQRLGSYSTV